MYEHFSDLNASERYHLMTQVIIPRPIAWVLTDNGDDRGENQFNLAPFSYFNAVSSDPALVMLSIGAKPSGVMKDTRKNIVERKNLVIHIPSLADMQLVSDSAETLDHGVSEVAKLNLGLVHEPHWPLPRLSGCKIAMACHLFDIAEIGANNQGIIFCEIDHIFIDDSIAVYDAKNRLSVSAAKVDPLCRLGANQYASLGEVLSLQRPK